MLLRKGFILSELKACEIFSRAFLIADVKVLISGCKESRQSTFAMGRRLFQGGARQVLRRAKYENLN
jgi:hypothetical protein